jgi:hypothetical protein
MREYRCQVEVRAHRHRARFLARYFLHYWRFYLARNKKLRASWAFVARDRSVLLKWMVLIAFKTLRKIAQKERAVRRKVLRHWHAVMRMTSENRHLTLAQIVVRFGILSETFQNLLVAPSSLTRTNVSSEGATMI